jgi:prevent-host-death family protein
MRAVGLRILKNKLSEYVRAVTAGETILVTDHERVVAELVPPHPGRADFATDALLAAAVRSGWVTAPLVASGLPPSRPCLSFAELMDDLNADRSDR